MKHLAICAVLVAGIGYASNADAFRLTFNGRTNNDETNTSAGEDQLTVDILEVEDLRGGPRYSGITEFLFSNTGQADFRVVGIYFQDSNLLGDVFDTFGSPGVAFFEPEGIPTFPGGGIDPSRYFQAFDPTPSRSLHGIGPNEFWAVQFDTLGNSFQDVIQALIDGTLRLGVVAEYADGSIESFLADESSLTAIPLPQGAGLAAAGLLGLAAVRRRRMA